VCAAPIVGFIVDESPGALKLAVQAGHRAQVNWRDDSKIGCCRWETGQTDADQAACDW
jgi:hypothetical protein